MKDIKKLNRIKVVFAEKDKTSKWLTEQVGKSNCAVSKWYSNVAQPDLQTNAENSDIRIVHFLKALILFLVLNCIKKVVLSFMNLLKTWIIGQQAIMHCFCSKR